MKRFVLSLLLFTFLSNAKAQICQTLTVSSTSLACNGDTNGSATVTALGGALPYTYTWSPGGGNASTASGLSAGVYTVRVADAGTCIVQATVNIAQPNFFLAVKTQTNVQCFGTNIGAVTYTTVGGTPAMAYTFSPYGGNGLSATGLAPGNFTFFVKDANGCTLTETFTITGPTSSLIATTTQTNNSCGSTNGGASVLASGGTAPYTYTWLPTGGNGTTAILVSGIYSVNIKDANSCTITKTVNIIQSSQFTLTPTVANISCYGAGNGSVTVAVNGGTSPFTYTWSPSGGNTTTATGLGAGTYTLRANDAAGCSGSITVTIIEPASLTGSSSQTNILCNGGTGAAGVFLIGGVTPYTYTWSPSGGNSATSGPLTPGLYTVNVRDANLCVVSQTFNITQPPALTATTSQSNILCFGAATGTAGIVVSGGVPSYSYSWSPSGGTSFSATALTAGVYTVTAKDNNSCTISRSFTITQPAQIIATVATTSIACNGQNTGSATLTVSGGTPSYSYTWSPSGGNGASAGTLTAGTYSVLVMDGNSCTITPTVLIAQPLLLTSTVTSGNVTCFGLNNGTASLTVTGGITPYTYSWTPGTATTPSVSGLVPGSYSVTVKDANLCSSFHTFSITSPTQFSVSAATTSILCGGQNTGSATITTSGATPAYTYSWVPAGGTASVGTALAAGNYSVIIKDANNCSTLQTLSIIEPAVFSGTINSSPANCNNPDGSATVTVSGGVGVYTYTWSPTGGNTATATALSAGQYTSTVTDQNNCQLNLVTVVAAINPSVILTASDASVCSGASSTLTASGSLSYTWNPASSLSSANGSVVTSSPLASTVYSVTGSSQFGCTVTNTISVSLLPDPTPTLTINSSNLCVGTTATLNAAGATGFTWSPAPGLSNAFISNPTLTISSPVIYTLTASNALGCTGTSTLSLVPLALPVVTVSNNTAVCIGETTTLTAGGANTYSWSNGSLLNPIQVTPATSTLFVVTGTATNGCVNTATVSVTVNPLPLVGISSQSYVCQGATAVLTATGATTYTWNTGVTGAALSVTPSANSSYSVTGTDANGCKNTSEFNLVIYMTPVFTVTGKREACRNEKITLTASGASNYTWSTGDQTPSVTYGFISNTIITVSSGTADCAPGTFSLSITVNQSPSITVTATSAAIYAGQSTQLTAISTATDYSWKPSDGLSCTNCASPIAKPTVSTTYTVEVNNPKGCKGSATQFIQVDAGCGALFAPTAFSPNNDGSNDTWCIYGNCIETLTCEIFNRWGQKVFTMSSKDQCWDGNVNGVQQNSGAFIYQVQATLTNGETKSLKGNFTLIR